MKNQNSQLNGAAGAIDRCNSGGVPQGLDCIPLVRFSSDKQYDSYSAERQVDLVKANCARFDWTYNNTLKAEDLGVSASQINPKTGLPFNLSPDAALGGLLQKWEAGKVDLNGKVIGAEAVNRFSRGAIGISTSVFWSCVKRGLSFFFINDNLFVQPGDENNLEKQLIMLVKLDAANQMARELGKRISDTLDLRIAKAEKGEVMAWGGSELYYIVHLERPKAHFEWDGINYPTLMRLVSEALDPANKADHAIATALNREKVPTFKDGKRIRNGKPSKNCAWSANTIRRILTRPALVGTFTIETKVRGADGKPIAGQKRKVTIPNYFLVDGKPAVTQEQYTKLQARYLRENDEQNPKGAGGGSSSSDRVTSLFPGLAQCSKCGKRMAVCHYYQGKRDDLSFRKFKCMGMADHSSDCDHPTLYADSVETHFFTTFLRKSPDEFRTQRDEQQKQRLDALQVELVSVSNQIKALLRMGAQNAGMEDEVGKELSPLRDRKVALKEEIAKLEINTAQTEDSTITRIWDIVRGDEVDVDALIMDVGKFVSRIHDNTVRRQLIGPIKQLVSKIEIDADRCRYRVTLRGNIVSEWQDVSVANKAIRSSRYADDRKVGKQ